MPVPKVLSDLYNPKRVYVFVLRYHKIYAGGYGFADIGYILYKIKKDVDAVFTALHRS
jgi:hypothetical protein